MLKVGPTIPPVVAAIIISLAVGGVGGYYVRFFYFESSYRPASPPPGGGGGMGAGMGGGMGMGSGGGQSQNATELTRLVRNLALVQRVQGKGLNATQAQQLAPILKDLKSAEKLSDKDCETKLAAINKILTDEQKKTLEGLQPPRGGGMGGMGGMMRMGGGGGLPAPPGFMGASGGGTSGGGPRAPIPTPLSGGGGGDPERPFASERNRQALEELMTWVEAQSKK